MYRVVIAATLVLVSLDRAVGQVAPAPACPVTTQVENTTLARAWHEEVINRRNPDALKLDRRARRRHARCRRLSQDAGQGRYRGHDGGLLSAFPDLVYTFDQFIATDNPL